MVAYLGQPVVVENEATGGRAGRIDIKMPAHQMVRQLDDTAAEDREIAPDHGGRRCRHARPAARGDGADRHRRFSLLALVPRNITAAAPTMSMRCR
ncbi:MAG TPA: hypothetical protein VFL43_16920 [Variovorax sp.]|nr:hypothetical protein [Variovorax sp.]